MGRFSVDTSLAYQPDFVASSPRRSRKSERLLLLLFLFSLPFLCPMGVCSLLNAFARLACALPRGPPLCRRTLGLHRHALDLVGQLAARLYVFQSLVVPCAFRFRRRSFPLVLARDALFALARTVVDSRRDRRPHAQRLLRQRHAPRGPSSRSAPPLFPRLSPERFRRAQFHPAHS